MNSTGTHQGEAMIGRAFDSIAEFRASDEPGWVRVQPTDRAAKLGIAWQVRAPDGRVGSIRPEVHTVEEHEDGTITMSPSLMMPSGWHGWLRRGEFTVA